MEVKKNVEIRYDMIGVDRRVCQYLVSFILNSDVHSLNEYFAERGSAANLVSDEEWERLVNFGNKLHQAMRG